MHCTKILLLCVNLDYYGAIVDIPGVAFAESQYPTTPVATVNWKFVFCCPAVGAVAEITTAVLPFFGNSSPVGSAQVNVDGVSPTVGHEPVFD